MNKDIQQKMAQYKKMANSHNGNTTQANSQSTRSDSLSKVVRSKKDADIFMAEVESAFQRVK
jgi:hypothetical protein